MDYTFVFLTDTRVQMQIYMITLLFQEFGLYYILIFVGMTEIAGL